MTTVTVGNSSSATLSATSTVTVTPAASTGRASVNVARDGVHLYNRTLRNPTTIGPYLENDVVTVYSDLGSTVYTVDAFTASVADVGFANPMTTSGDTIVGGTSGAPARQAKVMTTAGDIIIGGASGVQTRLAKGTDGQVLTMVSGAPAWATP